MPPQRPFYRDFGDAAGREKYHADAGFDPEDLESVFAQAFGGRSGASGGRRFSMRGQDAQYQLTLDFLDAANGTTRRVTLPDGRTLDVRIPAGVRDGQVIRLKGQGMPGIGDGAPGDALVEVAVAPHPLFRREGDDIIVELPVTLQEAVTRHRAGSADDQGARAPDHSAQFRHAVRGCVSADEGSAARATSSSNFIPCCHQPRNRNSPNF